MAVLLGLTWGPLFGAELIAVFVGGMIARARAHLRATQRETEARVAAESANAAKNAFLATMSHEIRTPISGVIGLAAAPGAVEPAGQRREVRRTRLDRVEGAAR